jgi:hypothetical protein
MKRVTLLVLSVVMATVSVSDRAAYAGVVTLNSDAEFIALQTSGAFAKTFGGNVRWGDALAAGDWEYAIVNSGDFPIGSPANSPWTGTNAHDVTFTYDGVGSATLALSGIGSITRAVPPTASVMFARVKDSVSPLSLLSNITLDLAFNGVGVDYSYSLLTGDSNAEYWGVIDPNLQLGFTLRANAVLDGPRSAGSDPMYQFKVGVPEPGTALLVCLGGLLATRRGRRR